MDIRQKLARATELQGQIDTLSQELASLFGEGEAPEKAQRKCGKCGQPGHQARTCTATTAIAAE